MVLIIPSNSQQGRTAAFSKKETYCFKWSSCSFIQQNCAAPDPLRKHSVREPSHLTCEPCKPWICHCRSVTYNTPLLPVQSSLPLKLYAPPDRITVSRFIQKRIRYSLIKQYVLYNCNRWWNVTHYICISFNELVHEYFHFIRQYTSTPLQPRGKYSTFLLHYNHLTAVVVGTRGVTIYSADEARRYTVLGSGEGGQI